MAAKQDKYILTAILLIFGVGGLLLLLAVNSSSLHDGGAKIGIVEIKGTIFNSEPIVKQLETFRKDSSIKAVVVRIESPGGGIAASQEIYEHVRRVRDSGKPVIASMGSVAASGGYYVALGADSIMANPGTTTGSIGVIAEFPNVDKLMDKLGIEMTVVKSGRFKDTGSPFRQPTEQEIRYLQQWIDDGYAQFLEVVAKERNLPEDQVRELADGRIYSGRQALALGLIDTLGTYRDAVALAAKAAGVKGEPKPVRLQKKKMTLVELILGQDVRERLVERLAPQMLYLLQ
ncbi:MAG: signal peptide peptidase SppA [candidate division KSB1 bacterium]|nr:signal peptide peptidase SppA [candidate division KSB1 bacterium]MDZ7346133.1 signal peptide peptidase SppA [candidate division KSB1 bacterium]